MQPSSGTWGSHGIKTHLQFIEISYSEENGNSNGSQSLLHCPVQGPSSNLQDFPSLDMANLTLPFPAGGLGGTSQS